MTQDIQRIAEVDVTATDHSESADLLAAFFYACATTITRHMGQAEPPALMALFGNFAFLIGCGTGLLVTGQFSAETVAQFPVLLTPYQSPPAFDLTILLATDFVTLGGFILVPRAYQLAPVSVVSPFEYSYLLWALLIGLVFFGERPSPTTMYGAAMVITAGLYIARREAKARRNAQQAATT